MTLAATHRRDGLAAAADDRLTALEVGALYFVAEHERVRGGLPTKNVIAERFGITAGEADAVLERLETEGYLAGHDSLIVAALAGAVNSEVAHGLPPAARHCLMILALEIAADPMTAADVALATGWSTGVVNRSLAQLVASAFATIATPKAGRTPATYRAIQEALEP